MSRQDEDRRSDITQTIVRAVMALKLAAQHPELGVRVTDVARALEVSKPTAFRILRSLSYEHLLEQVGSSRRYRPGGLLFELGLTASRQYNLSSHCLPILQQLALASGDTSFLFVRSGDDALCIQRVVGHAARQTPVLPVGSRQPLGVSAGGLALLAFLPPAEQDEVLDKIDARLEGYGQLRTTLVRRLIEQTRRVGYAWTHNHAVPGTGAIGLPIFDGEGGIMAAVTVASSWTRMDPGHIGQVLPLLRLAARETGSLLRA